MMEYEGQVKNGVVVLNGGARLPEGAVVRVLPVEEQPTWGEVFEDVMGRAEDLPPDLARNHDHYLHGSPKQ